VRKFIIVALFITSLLLVLAQASNSSWSYHLRSDSDGFYYSRANYFLKHGNLTNLGYNEYQPGAVAFFLSISPVLLLENNNNTYLGALFVTNVVLLIFLALIFHKVNPYFGPLSLIAIFLSSGPIILYRFELFTTLLVVMAITLWQKKHFNISIAFLATSTLVKIYPVLLLPVFLLATLKSSGIKTVISMGMIFIGTIFGLLSIYLLFFQIPLSQIILDANIHALKPVHAESLWASLLVIFSWLKSGVPAAGKGSMGIYGIDPKYVVGPMWFYNYFWVATVGVIYIVIWKRITKIKINLTAILIVVLLCFLIFSKILTGQYLLWFALLYPIIFSGKTKNDITNWSLNLVLICAILLATQIIYPLKYNELLAGFYTNGSYSEFFWLLTIRNILMIYLFFRFVRNTLFSR